ncbi:hypothetical protein L9F63_025359, partial [Diploptera punctata]
TLNGYFDYLFQNCSIGKHHSHPDDGCMRIFPHQVLSRNWERKHLSHHYAFEAPALVIVICHWRVETVTQLQHTTEEMPMSKKTSKPNFEIPAE